MCGIAGAVAREPRSDVVAAARALTAALAHRGPDASGFWTDDAPLRSIAEQDLPAAARMVLGHRRLSIVDVTGGAQPMSNETGTAWVSYNGEIYNAADLRAELEGKGHVFRTRADTEVLVHGWEEWREQLFGRLNGMFAFAVAEPGSGSVWLVRDPIGIKPLYLGVHGATTWWSSELGAARNSGLTGETIDTDSLKLYLTFRFVPAPRAILRGTWKIPPGSFVCLRAGAAGEAPAFASYHSTVRSSAAPRGAAEWGEAIEGTLRSAVRRQLMSDVPVASLLSGGVDSSLVTMMMHEVSGAPPVTFGIGFAGDGESSELVAGRRAAAALGVDFVPTEITDADYLADWPASHRRMGEPVGNSSSLLLGLLCRTVSRTHKVVLTGQGADEPLGGYPRHTAERLYGLGRLAPAASARVVQRLLGSDTGDRLSRVLATPDRAARYAEILTVLPSHEVDALVPGGTPAAVLAREAVARWLPEDAARDSLNALLRVDARMSLADDLLTVADHFSMAASVELRVPFLDLELLELLDRMPSRYKVSWTGGRKWLYRRTALAALPASLASSLGGASQARGRKAGFSTPVDRWFGEPRGVSSQVDWLHDLIRIPGLNVTALRASNGLTGDRRRVRQRMALYALAKWHG